MRRLVYTLAMEQILDALTTWGNLRQGAVEGNPLMWWCWQHGGLVTLLGYKALIMGSIVLFVWHIRGWTILERATQVLLLLAIALFALVIGNNLIHLFW